MSINITSTSDRLATDSQTSSSAQEEGKQKYAGMSAPMAALPDPAVIAKLANEFFAALPGAPATPSVSSVSPNEVDLGAVPGAAPRTAAPDYPREMFSFPAAPDPRSVPGKPQLSSAHRHAE